MPSLSSDEEDAAKAIQEDDSDDDEVNEEFEFGGILVSFRRDLIGGSCIGISLVLLTHPFISIGRRRWCFRLDGFSKKKR